MSKSRSIKRYLTPNNQEPITKYIKINKHKYTKETQARTSITRHKSKRNYVGFIDNSII